MTAEAQTLLATLVRRRNLTQPEARKALSKRAEQFGDETFDVSRRQWQRWVAGQVSTLPHPRQRRVLEAEYGHPTEQLLAPPAR